MTTENPITLSQAREATKKGEYAFAEKLSKDWISRQFELDVKSVEVRRDSLSLNSVNGYIDLADEKSPRLFFKFHQEEKEESTLTEYYNTKLLEENGFPVEAPLYVSQKVGEQMLIYPLKQSERLADVCKRLDFSETTEEWHSIVQAQERLDALCLESYLHTLHVADAGKIEAEPLLQLFYWRLVDGREKENRHEIGGRVKRFYLDKKFALPDGNKIDCADLFSKRWNINGVTYQSTLHELFVRSHSLLSPEGQMIHGRYSALIAHGDAHNGNIWYNADATEPYLTLFDPAFAGRSVPALLAEIKPTFHNIFAHPLWLYDAKEADGLLQIQVDIQNDLIVVKNNWQLSDLRRAFLKIKCDIIWKPLLQYLKTQNLLSDFWREFMRLALFCCPTLVMNLRSGEELDAQVHTPKTSFLGLAIAVMLGSEPIQGRDEVVEFFDEIGEAVKNC